MIGKSNLVCLSLLAAVSLGLSLSVCSAQQSDGRPKLPPVLREVTRTVQHSDNARASLGSFVC